ncbi:tryptophanyl-tRNA synthetase [Inhella inkyongensis]|uniref:Tryptophan--tRNA ligase n=1 Tax=Inhella inkyongensis TaxID=392593 RepID=A0A840S514_9BURK|nr:tryptophan--tRNA ligase [Inhella inkyongensis]MBB5206417.1 tryptophanyl-tRNA synthetase [Inhella inkyongensis]
MTAPARVVSGMRPTGALHLGHYHGVLKTWLNLQQEHDCLFFVADWHALTQEDQRLGEGAVYDMVVDWLAAGIDPQRATLFIQSRMPEHAELFTLLSLWTPLSWLERVPGFREVADQHPSFGRLGYPLLQAADILAYKADWVPVGQDQAAHLELCRELARRFNHRAERTVFPLPQAVLSDAPRLPGLDGQKMSKSAGNTIAMREDPASTRTKVLRMPTDPQRVHRQDPGDPERCPVWPLHQVTTPPAQQADLAQACRSAKVGCVDCKEALLEGLLPQQAIWRERAESHLAAPKQVHWLVEVGTERARALARKTLREVRDCMGLTA